MNNKTQLSPSGVAIPIFFVPVIAALIAIGPLSMDIYLPAIPTMQDFFNVGIESVNSSIAVFVLGSAIGQFFGGPVSDQVGRKVVGISGLFIFIVGTFSILLTVTIEQLQFVRFIQAIGGGLATAICMGAIRDAYSPTEAALKFPIMTMIMMLAPLLSPTLGMVLLKIHWKAIFVFLGIYGLIVSYIYLVKIPETRSKIAARVSLPKIFKQYYEVISHRHGNRLIASRYVCVMALTSAITIVFITASAFVYMDYFQISATRFPLFFGANVIGMISANFLCLKLMKVLHPYNIMAAGLITQLALSAVLVILVLINATPLWLIAPLIVLTVAAGGLITPNGMAIYMSFFPAHGGSASAVFTTLMFVLGGAFGGLTAVLHNGSLLPVFAVMFTLVILANVIFSFLPKIELENSTSG